MPTGMSTFVADGVLNAVFNGVAFSVTEVWIQLHVGDPGAAGTLSPAVETDRQQLAAATSTGGSITSDGVLTWTSISGSEDPTHWSAWDAAAGGNFLGSGAITSAAYAAGNTFNIPASDFDLTMVTATNP